MEGQNNFDVIIIGGSYAGLSSAMALGRSMQKVLVIDSGLPCNRFTPHSHNFITQDGETPSAITKKAKEQVLHYSNVTFVNGLAVSGEKTGNGFTISTGSDLSYKSAKLVIAAGIRDILPDIKGFSECWGISVVHCPYCHGYELRGRRTAILANGEKAVHLASLVNNLTGDITILTNDKAAFTDDQRMKLNNHNIKIIEITISEIVHEHGEIKRVVFEDGTKEDFSAAFASVPFEQHCAIPVSLGCALSETGHIKVDNFQQTTIEGVYACGDNCSPMRSVANAVYSGNITGAMVNKSLIEEHF